jgi:hypothetical protein
LYACMRQVLYPLLSPGGYVIVDDFMDWDGCRQVHYLHYSLERGTKRCCNRQPLITGANTASLQTSLPHITVPTLHGKNTTVIPFIPLYQCKCMKTWLC